MKTYNVPLESFISKGKVSLKVTNDELHMITLEEGLSKKHQNYAYILDRLKLPFRIDMRLKTNSPQFKFKIGKGHIMFTGNLNHYGSAIRRADILKGTEERTKYDYDNNMPINEYFDLSIVYGNKKTWIELNGQYCYFTGKAPYIKLLESNAVPEEFGGGLDFAVVCADKVELMIKSLMITEYENDEPHIPEEIANMPELSPFEWYLKSLPHELRDEVRKIDDYLMKNMKENLKFKKSVSKDGKLFYASPSGFQYSILRYGIGEPHIMGWHKYWDEELKEIIWTGDWGIILNKIAESSPEFSNRMFSNIHLHIGEHGCKKCAFTNCGNMASIEYNGETKRSCGGAMKFNWIPSEFEDVRKVISAVSEVVKAANNM